MSLVVLGLSHHTCPVEIRERLAFPPETLPVALARLRKYIDEGGFVILSTCNRVEIYAHHPGASASSLVDILKKFLSDWHQLSEDVFADGLYSYEEIEAAGHLFRVAAGVDSLVVGETQILGQVHDAYLAAQTQQTTDKIIHALFQRAFSTAKTVRSESGIGTGKVSISSVAVDLAAAIFRDFEKTTVLVIGGGETAELTLRSLCEKGARRILIVNRSQETGENLAVKYKGTAHPWQELSNAIAGADIVISSTAAPEYILRVPDMDPVLRLRKGRPIFFIDIAVPRDIDPRVAELPDVYLYNMDDLQHVVERNMEARRRELTRCIETIDKNAQQFIAWMASLAAEPTIRSMADELHQIREQELDKTLHVLSNLSEAEKQEVRYLSERIVNRILQRPMREIKQEIGHHDPHTVLHLVKRMFGLGE
ncbi:MAG TPA: glutamyl-tRNA reductase [Candidatus Hydrogenedentes bacterium]|nr:glutamyl-tRNA reductase [Candidatus Hydrogenedentota bacterium]HOL77165.1 glutamyl-tRNA reductase [Candidatus Hydrogenedentota bacterium]HPO85896.1 glutamyl-tRNA reductase [Candidatus Hydrogenedentota bacterium]